MRVSLAIVAIAALVAVPAAAGHGGGGSRGYTSTVTSVAPAVAGLSVTVREGDDRLMLSNETGRTVVILGYEGEPYLQFRPDGVYENRRSPATYLNDDRHGKVDLPAGARASASPEWERVEQRPTFEWHDHRIHWMSTTPPPKVAAAEGERHHVFDWKVPGTIGGRTLQIAGSLDYAPPPGQKLPMPLLILVAVIVALGFGLVWWRQRRLADK
jgi:hypothetical protein